MSSRSLSRLAAATSFAMLAALGSPLALVAHADPPPGDSFTGVAGNSFHDGHPAGDPLAPPLATKWSTSMDVTPPGRALMVGNSIFMPVDQPGSAALWAMDRRTGGTLWGPVKGVHGYLTYDSGRIFALGATDQSNTLTAVDAASGGLLWTAVLPGQQDYAAPVARNGMVYLSGDTTLAVDQSTGNISWSRRPFTGGVPAVTDTDIYIADDCGVSDLSASTGERKWRVTPPCVNSLSVAVYHDGYVFASEATNGGSGSTAVVAASDGHSIGSIPTTNHPAFEGSTGVYLSGGQLQSFDAHTLALGWIFPGDGQLASDPLMANGYVFEQSLTGQLYVLRESDGSVAWSGAMYSGSSPYFDYQPVSVAMASGTLLVTAGAHMFAVAAAGQLPAASVDSISPPEGQTAGGTVVTVTGTNLSAVTAVRFGSQPASAFTVLSDTMLRATSPPGQNGSVPVTVSTTEGSSPAIERFADTFTYFGPAPDVPGDEATTYHVDPQHVGSVSGDSLVLPTRRRWSADLGGTVSYPLVTGGRVYILAKTGASTTGLEALDAVTGATAWGPVPTGTGLVLTYDRGMIFTLAADGTTRAFDAATGSAQWSRAMGGSPRSLIAADGTLYASDPASSGVTALSESTGATLWTSSVPPIGSPAVRGRVIYPNAGSCPGSPALRTQDGSHLWQGSGLCALTPDGPGVSLYRGRLYGSGRVADALTGQQVGAAPGLSLSLLSTFVGDTRISVNFGAPGATDPNRRIEATDLGTRATTWSDLMPSVVAYAPITVNGVVYDATVDGQVYGIDAATGVTRWSDATAQALTAETLWGDASTPVTGLAAGEGMLLVPAGNLLIAYDSQASEVAASVGPSHTLAEYNSNTGHRSLGGYILGAPAVVAIPQPSGPPKVFYVAAGPGGTLWTRSDSDKWQRLVSGTQPINCQDSVGAAVAGPSLVVACKGTDGALWTGTATIGAGPPVSAAASWMTLGGQLVAGPAVGQVNGSTNFFVTGTDQQVWQRTATSGWAPTGWRCAGHPALVGVQSLSYFACRGIDRTLMISQAQAGAWAPLRSVGGQLVDGPGIAASAAGAVYFVEGTDRGLWRLDLRAQTAGGWVRVGSDAGQGASATSVAAP